MRIHPTPERLRPPAINYPTHHAGANLEQAFGEYAVGNTDSIDTSWIYLPIYWQNLYFVNERASRTQDYYHDPEAQEVVNALDPKETYFTLSQADEGTYEKLPGNVRLFNAGGRGHYPIPLLASPLGYTEIDRIYLASFIGAKEAGGPIDWPLGRAEHSSWNKDGVGARVRRAMFKSLEGKKGFYLQESRFTGKCNYVDDYRKNLCQSVFILAPRGYGKTSFRMYEALHCGCIPVYIYDEPWLPFTDVLDWSEFAVLCHWTKMDTLPVRLWGLLEDREALQRMQKRALEVARAYFFIPTAARRCAELVERTSRRA